MEDARQDGNAKTIVQEEENFNLTQERVENAPIPDDSPRKIREVNIRALNYGFLVKIDCHEFAIETVEKLTEKLAEYYKNPTAVENLWWETKKI